MVLVSILVLAAIGGTALAGSGPGAVFNLGKTNRVNAQTSLVGSFGRSIFHVTNKSPGSSAGAIGAFSSGPGATLTSTNGGAGSAASFLTSTGVSPFTVNSSVQVPNLNAQYLQGDTPASFYAAGSEVSDAAHAHNADTVDTLQVRAFSYSGDENTGQQQFVSLGGLLLSASCGANASITLYASTTQQDAYLRDSSGAIYDLSPGLGPANLKVPTSGGGIETIVYDKSSAGSTSYNAPVITVTLSYEQRPINVDFCQAFGTATGAP